MPTKSDMHEIAALHGTDWKRYEGRIIRILNEVFPTLQERYRQREAIHKKRKFLAVLATEGSVRKRKAKALIAARSLPPTLTDDTCLATFTPISSWQGQERPQTVLTRKQNRGEIPAKTFLDKPKSKE